MRFLADENFDINILDGVRRVNPDFDVIRVQDTELDGVDDPTILAWAAKEGRLVLTHDVNTMVDFAYDRVRAGLSMPGIIEIHDQLPIAIAIGELLVFDGASDAAEWENQVIYLPMR